MLVYGVVGLIVKMDDLGLRLAQQSSAGVAGFGRGLVKAMPKLLTVIAVVGTAAMLWVGGHILLVGTDELGWHGPYDLVHTLEEAAHDAVSGAAGSSAGSPTRSPARWSGSLVGAVVVLVLALVAKARGGSAAAH